MVKEMICSNCGNLCVCDHNNQCEQCKRKIKLKIIEINKMRIDGTW